MTRTRARNASHGTRSKYTTGCRCDECRAANTAYQADWERRNPAAKARHDAQRAAWKRSDKGRAASRAWKERNAEQVRAKGRAYYASNREKIKAGVAAARRREQADTIPTSINHRMEWTAADEAELVRLYGTVPVRELAAKLHRTASGVRSRVLVLRCRGEL